MNYLCLQHLSPKVEKTQQKGNPFPTNHLNNAMEISFQWKSSKSKNNEPFQPFLPNIWKQNLIYFDIFSSVVNKNRKNGNSRQKRNRVFGLCFPTNTWLITFGRKQEKEGSYCNTNKIQDSINYFRTQLYTIDL